MLIVKVGRYLRGRSKFWSFALGVGMIAVIGEVDLLTGPEIGFSIFYLFPIGFMTWSAGRAQGIVLSLLSAGVWLAADLGAGAVYSSPAIPYWNAMVRLGLFLIVTHTLSALSVSLEWARTDYLTGLVNVRGFHDLAIKELHQSRRNGRGYSLAYLDIDDFKSVNDSLGHNAGDSLLRLLGDTLRKATRKSDIVARTGGDEFTIWLSDTDYEVAASALRNIQERLRAAAARSGWTVTFSVGLVTFQRPPESVSEAIAQADSLMYAAKHAGKNTVVHRFVESLPGRDAPHLVETGP
jgi:diguanylate cyclase (GGDEF)-like protein